MNNFKITCFILKLDEQLQQKHMGFTAETTRKGYNKGKQIRVIIG